MSAWVGQLNSREKEKGVGVVTEGLGLIGKTKKRNELASKNKSEGCIG